MVHILPHWNWPDRVGQVTPVHLFTSGDECELFLNGKSLGRKTRGEFEYRIRWDDVIYETGVLKAVAYKDGEVWAEETVQTTGEPALLKAKADRNTIRTDGKDLSFITVRILDREGHLVPDADNRIEFSIEGPGDLVATDNGDPADFTSFPSPDRKAFNGLALAIVRFVPGESGPFTAKVDSPGLEGTSVTILGE
jgi:beta-galactosidase